MGSAEVGGVSGAGELVSAGCSDGGEVSVGGGFSVDGDGAGSSVVGGSVTGVSVPGVSVPGVSAGVVGAGSEGEGAVVVGSVEGVPVDGSDGVYDEGSVAEAGFPPPPPPPPLEACCCAGGAAEGLRCSAAWGVSRWGVR